MAKSSYQFTTTMDAEQVGETVRTIVTAEGFQESLYQNFPVWLKGGGWLSMRQYIYVTQRGSTVTLTAWLQDAIGIQEGSLDSFPPTVPQRALRKVVKKIQAALSDQA